MFCDAGVYHQLWHQYGIGKQEPAQKPRYNRMRGIAVSSFNTAFQKGLKGVGAVEPVPPKYPNCWLLCQRLVFRRSFQAVHSSDGMAEALQGQPQGKDKIGRRARSEQDEGSRGITGLFPYRRRSKCYVTLFPDKRAMTAVAIEQPPPPGGA